MYIIRPSWLGHFAENETRQPIYSLDVANDGARLVTGGLDGKVKIWSVTSCLEASEELEKSGLLATMSANTGSVLCVRFSPNGRWLASGSDDKVLIIWERDESASATQTRAFGDKEEVKEVWKVHRRLVGHQGDIVDLAWSHDSALLVSTGIDSTIIIWSGTTFERKKEMRAHASSVKGITFDPAGKYFATASDDRTLKIWRTNDYLCEATISQPFQNSPITTYFRRPSWSPDGTNIAGANSMNGQVHSVSIIGRGTWDSDINLIGHENAVEVVKFNPVIFMRDGLQITIVACAGLDRTLSVWNTAHARPIMTASDIAEQGVCDLGWTPDGLVLFVCSFDGTLTIVQYEEAEFGKALGPDANEEALNKYGAGRHGAVMPESIEQLRLEEESRKEEEASKKGRIADLMGGTDTAVPQTRAELPTSLATIADQPDVEMTEALTKTTEGIVPAVSEPSVVATTEQTIKNVDSMIPSEQPVQEKAPASSAPSTAPKPYVHKVTMVNGKKRIQPQLISSGQTQPAFARPSTTVAASTSQTLNISQPSQALPKGGIPALIIGNKRAAEEEHQDAPSGKRTSSTVNGQSSEEVPEFLRPAVIAPASTVSAIRLGTPQIKSLISHNQINGTISYILEARNAENAHDPTKLTFMRGTKIEWIDYIKSSVVLLVGTPQLVAAGCEDGGILVWTLTGRRFISELVIEAIPSFLEARDEYLMAISSIGILHVWNLKEQRSPFPPVSLAPILDSATSLIDKIRRTSSVSQAHITADGVPILTLSNGDGYMYHADMHTFLKLSEGWWAISSAYWDASGLQGRKESGAGILGMIERRTNDEVVRQGKGRILSRIVKQAMMKEGFENLEATVSIGHLENRLSAAKMLKSKEEYHIILLMYARKIAEEGMTQRVEELCRELIGPMFKASEGLSSWVPNVLGLDKRELLRECLAQMGRYRGVQRVCTEYDEVLKRLTSV